ncbi:hypothetical protein OIO90_004893 [Microbotryomycetes sp. JL221]|nr:hypothetical protein OIO90_004893 [Microbotryomycetes sp. JL221]
MGSFTKLFKRSDGTTSSNNANGDRSTKRTCAHLSPPVDSNNNHDRRNAQASACVAHEPRNVSPRARVNVVAGLGVTFDSNGHEVAVQHLDRRKDVLIKRRPLDQHQRRKSSGSMDKLTAFMTGHTLEPQQHIVSTRPRGSHARTQSEPVVPLVDVICRQSAPQCSPTTAHRHGGTQLQRPLPPTPPLAFPITSRRPQLPHASSSTSSSHNNLYPQAYPTRPRPPLPPRPRGPNPIRQTMSTSTSLDDIAQHQNQQNQNAQDDVPVPATPHSVSSPVLPGAFPPDSPPTLPPPPPYVETVITNLPQRTNHGACSESVEYQDELRRVEQRHRPPLPKTPPALSAQQHRQREEDQTSLYSPNASPLRMSPAASSQSHRVAHHSHLPYLNSPSMLKQSCETPTKTSDGLMNSPGRNQCCGTTGAGKRCTRVVTTTPSNSPRGKSSSDDANLDQILLNQGSNPISRYCFQHSKQAMNERGCFVEIQGRQAKWIEFQDWILSDLPLSTQLALRHELSTRVSLKDEPGYLYVHEMVEQGHQRHTSVIKLGRSTKPVQRLNQWRHQCRSREPVIRGIFPQQQQGEDPGTTIQFSKHGLSNHRKWERLCLIELDGRAQQFQIRQQQQQHQSQQPSRALSSRGQKECIDCGKVHVELFEFEKGAYDDWIKDLVERWARWCGDVLVS